MTSNDLVNQVSQEDWNFSRILNGFCFLVSNYENYDPNEVMVSS